jgi:hypothetical protein
MKILSVVLGLLHRLISLYKEDIYDESISLLGVSVGLLLFKENIGL